MHDESQGAGRKPWGDLALWPHQASAVELVQRFLAAAGDGPGPSALIRLPTGTGKSGVIAVAAQLPAGDVLLLTPWDALAIQLADDVRSRFWHRIGAPPPQQRIQRLYPSSAQAELADFSRTVWVATIAALQQLRSRDLSAYQRLGSRLGLVIVDEGHYEPALRWSEAVRGLGQPTVLLTATPYRNDLKYFNVSGDEYTYQYSHQEAEDERYLRDVEFGTLDYDSPASFCDGLLTATDSCLSQYARPKIIVRCATKNSVQLVAAELGRRRCSVVAVHEGFRSDGLPEIYRSHVPDPVGEKFQFWVHQNKLTEGLDSSEFRMIAFYEPFRRERAFVQQVGRVLRNPGRRPGQVAWVMGSESADLRSSWEAYRAYDRSSRGTVLPPSSREFARSQPQAQYLGGKFRQSLDLDAPEIHREFLYPLSVRAYLIDDSFDIDLFTESVQEALDDADFDLGAVSTPDPSVRVHPYISAENSPLLARSAFIEFKVGFTAYRRIGNYLFFLDTHRLTPDPLHDLQRVPPDKLRRLFAGANAKLTSISTLNTNLGSHSVRRRSLDALSVGDLGPDLSDHAHLATTSEGVTSNWRPDGERDTRRYVGFVSGRVRDGELVDYDDFMAWLETVAYMLNDNATTTLAVFERYAEEIDRPDRIEPSSILLDIPSNLFAQLRDDESGEYEMLDIEDACMNVSQDGTFHCTANGTEYRITVTWNEAKRKYQLSCGELDMRYSMVGQPAKGSARSLIRYINNEQCFRIVTAGAADEYCVYTGRLVCRPRLPLARNAEHPNMDLMGLVSGFSALNSIDSEKGAEGSAVGSGWSEGSLFHLVDTLGAGTDIEEILAGVDLLVCDDMGTETADFFALDLGGGRIVAMHLKAFKTAKALSASAFHEVSSQALKNLGYIQPYRIGSPKNLSRWDGAWNGGKIGVVDRRIRRGSTRTGEEAWERFRGALADPQTSREVWILLGQGPPKSLLKEESLRDAPKPEMIQMLYSLQSTWSAVASVGARLRVLTAA